MFIKLNKIITKSPTKNYFCILDFTSKESENKEIELFKSLCPRLQTIVDKRNKISSLENSLNLSRLLHYYVYDEGYIITAYNMYSRRSIEGDFLDYDALYSNLNMLKEFMNSHNIDIACSSDIGDHFKSDRQTIANIFNNIFSDCNNTMYMCRSK